VPVFLIAGQLAVCNHAAVRYLVRHHRQLARRYGVDGRFAVLVRQNGAAVYGADSTVQVHDISAAAFA
jgi:hypothetical protein